MKFIKTQKEAFKKDGTDIHEAGDRTNKVYKRYLKQLKAEKE